MFFKKEEKDLAKRCSQEYLNKKYEQTERKLVSAANTGNLSNVKKAMKEHHKYEYALLFQQYNSNKK
ncbi:MAG: hypothetical protein ACI35W_01405 [Anaeroplasmataceae bacterium]